MMMKSKFVVLVILMLAITALFVGSSSARPLGGNVQTGASAAGVVNGKSILQLLQRLYLQNLQGASCKTNDPNGGCPPPPSG
ncbi:hypothetical protein CFC21_097010 [Triticum aestivum]|uniref:Uncharacterized protein n=2 Tax=Triticum aestivum TaxID=4565 RepID=A0A9R1MZ32_WHEAT|nr:hypothetical protein CFC21_097010 [Triticum aestivum]